MAGRESGDAVVVAVVVPAADPMVAALIINSKRMLRQLPNRSAMFLKLGRASGCSFQQRIIRRYSCVGQVGGWGRR